MRKLVLLALAFSLTLAVTPVSGTSKGTVVVAVAGGCTQNFCNDCPSGTICVERGSGSGAFCLCRTIAES